MDYAIVRPNQFLQSVSESTIPSIDEDGHVYVDAGDARISTADTRDVAAVASIVLTEGGHSGAHYRPHGPRDSARTRSLGTIRRCAGSTVAQRARAAGFRCSRKVAMRTARFWRVTSSSAGIPMRESAPNST